MNRKNTTGLFFLLPMLLSLNVRGLAATDFPTFTDITYNSGFGTNNRGCSAAWGDFNNDGLVDLYICNAFSQPNVLYQNLGNGQFLDITIKAGVGGDDYSLHACWLDLNSDRNQDLFVLDLYNENKFYLNNGDGTFNEMFDSLGITKGIPAWIDINHDGLLDVYVGRGDKNYSNAATLHNHFFLNQDGLKFRDFSKETFLLSEHYSRWPNWHDYNGDNFPDFYIINSIKKTGYLFRYNADRTFSNVLQGSTVKNICGTNFWADLDADGDQDYFIFENIGVDYVFYENQNTSFLLRGTGLFDLKAGAEEFQEANQVIDVNNDGLLDLQISTHKPQSEFDHYIKLYQNFGQFQFREVKQAIPFDAKWDIRYLDWADIDNDGDWDCVAILRDQIRLFRNNGTSNHYIKIILKGSDSHPDGIGATISVKTEKGNFRHWVGMGMGLQLRVREQILIGIGQADSIKNIQVIWPSGITQDTTNVPVNQSIILTEPATNWFVDQTDRAQLGNQIAKTMGGACADYDNDGDIDIYLVNNGTPSTLFENQGSAIFSDVSITAKISQSVTHLSSLFFDFDNDGHKDFFATNWYFQANVIYKNNGDKTFRYYNTEARLAEGNDSSLSVIVADFNNDGFLDFYQGHDGNNVFWLNSPEGFFVDYSKKSGTQDPYVAHGMAAFDYDNDGDLDIYVANSRGGENHYAIKAWPNILYQNNGDATFTDVTASAGVGCTANSKGVCVGDYDNDGDFDLYVTNDDSANILFRNNGDGTFTDVTFLAGVAEPLGAHGCHFVDFDNDGDLDLYVSGSSYIPEKHDYSMNKTHPNVLYRNHGDGTFTDITRYSGIENNIEQTPHILIADFDNDGYVDVHAGNAVCPGKKRVRNTYFQNRCRGNNYVHFKLTGTKSNRDAIGARMHVKSGNLSMWQHATYGYGFGSSHSEIIYFGLGKNTQIDSVTVYWPSGTKQILTENVHANQLNFIEEPFQWGPIQLSPKESALTIQISLIFGAIVLSSLLLIFMVPIIRKGWLVQKHERAEINLQKAGLQELQVFEVRIDLMPFKNDYLLIHSIKPLTPAAYNTQAFEWGRQETTPFVFKSDKILALRHRFRNIANQYLEFIQQTHATDEKILDELKETGSIIYAFLGLRGFFDTLFNHEKIENAQINFVVDNSLIPWYLAYDEAAKVFLCEKFPNSFLFQSLKNLHKPAAVFFTEAYKKPTGSKVVITLFGSWPNHERELSEVVLEVKNINRVFSANKIETQKVDTNVDQFLTTFHSLVDENKDIRIIHYSGHIEHNLLALGPNEFLDPAQLEKTLGIHFENGPVIFLNGCQTAEFWQEEDTITTHFLNAGAAACIVTHAKIPEKSARRFAVSFYEFYVGQNLTIAESLRQARLALASDRRNSIHPNDITRFVYNLYGNPATKF